MTCYVIVAHGHVTCHVTEVGSWARRVPRREVGAVELCWQLQLRRQLPEPAAVVVDGTRCTGVEGGVVRSHSGTCASVLCLVCPTCPTQVLSRSGPLSCCVVGLLVCSAGTLKVVGGVGTTAAEWGVQQGIGRGEVGTGEVESGEVGIPGVLPVGELERRLVRSVRSGMGLRQT